MPLSIYSNAAAANAQILLGRAQASAASSMAKLASGLRITTAADDPAGLGTSMVLDTQVRSFNQASRNTSDGISMVQTVDGALAQVHSSLQRMRELAVNSANGTLTTTERTNLQTEFSSLQGEIDRVSGSTYFGNQQLLNAAATFTLQVGANNSAADQVAVAVGASDSTTLKVNAAAVKVDSQTGAQNAMSAIDTAIASVSNSRASLGATQNRLNVALTNDQVFAANLNAAVGRIRDVDVAQVASDLARQQVLTQAGMAVLAQANQAPSIALSLLR